MTRLAMVVHFFPPWRSAGSETVAVELGRAAVAAGHEVRVWVTHQDAERNWRGNEPAIEFEGMTVHRKRNVIIAGNEVKQWKPGVIFSHHDHAGFSIKLAKRIGARSVFAVHNEFDLNRRPMLLKPDLTIFNSTWVEKSLTEKFGSPGESMTMHPPLTPDRHKVDHIGDSVTLINLNPDKGANLFYDLARRMPERPFVGVTGGHGKQVPAPKLPNLTIMDHGPDMQRVWSATRILVMPSVAESYGLTAVEAGINGIPTIAHPTPGLKENLGAGGLFCDRDKPTQWVRAIRALDDPAAYEDASKYAQGLADDAIKQTRQTLKQWTDWVESG